MITRSNRQGVQKLWILAALFIGSFLVLAWSAGAQEKTSKVVVERKSGAAPHGDVRVSVLWSCQTEPFEFNSSKLSDGQLRCLNEAVDRLRQNEQHIVVIEGHRDSSEREYISLGRVKEASEYLVNQSNIDAARIVLRNFCDSCQVEFTDPAKNRRIDIGIVIAPRDQKIPDDFILFRCPRAKLC